MKCPDEGLLQSYIDGEMDIDLKKHIEMHLLNCEFCSNIYKELKNNDDFAFEKMDKYRQYMKDDFIPAKARAAKFDNHEGCNLKEEQIKQKLNKGVMMMSYLVHYRKALAGFCALLVLAACVTIQPVRAAISNVLSVFRAEEISGISISAADIQEIQEKLNNNEPEIDMKKFGKIENTGGSMQQVTLSEAEEFAGFPVLEPAVPADTELIISAAAPANMNFTLNADNVNEVLASLGSKKLLPESIDQKTFTLNISKRILMSYNRNGSNINITQTTAPELVVPEGVDADEIYNSMIELPIIPDELQRQLEAIKDWKNTIYIPVTGTDTTEVDINGVKGYAGSRTNDDGRIFSAVVWSANGIIRTIECNLSRDEMLEIARSMK